GVPSPRRSPPGCAARNSRLRQRSNLSRSTDRRPRALRREGGVFMRGSERSMSTQTKPISAQMVAELRNKTGAGMMDCKKALEESGGDMAKAEDLLRVKYAARAEKRADRAAGQGVIEIYLHFNGKVASMV